MGTLEAAAAAVVAVVLTDYRTTASTAVAAATATAVAVTVATSVIREDTWKRSWVGFVARFEVCIRELPSVFLGPETNAAVEVARPE